MSFHKMRSLGTGFVYLGSLNRGADEVTETVGSHCFRRQWGFTSGGLSLCLGTEELNSDESPLRWDVHIHPDPRF